MMTLFVIAAVGSLIFDGLATYWHWQAHKERVRRNA
jgi:hypothetical protein